MRTRHLIAVLGMAAVCAIAAISIRAQAVGRGTAPAPQAGRAAAPPSQEGFTDTPMLPGLPYHVHDPARPKPKVVTPGARPGDAPSDAVVLFDGKDLSKWSMATLGLPGNLGASGYSVQPGAAPWKVESGYFEIVPGSGAIATRERFGDIQLHLEWASPNPARGTGQDRGNSGIFLTGLFETQILDSHNSPTYADGQAGALYGQWPPLVNATRAPGEWQTYDIVFETPRYTSGKLSRPASVTVFLNGLVLHNKKDAFGPTVYRSLPTYVAGVVDGPIVLQDHNHPVRFRNIWLRRLGTYDAEGR